MSKEIWVISDTHFGHDNIVKYSGRPYNDSTEMDEDIIRRWNNVVNDGDKVYHLGDVYMGCSRWRIENILSRLKGQKRLILGNHDNGKDQILQKYFKKIEIWRDFGKDFGLLLTHVPVHPTSLDRGYKKNGHRLVNVHGHIHTNKSPSEEYKNVCVEQINYTPVNIEELRVK